jgi:hypothetical protein
MIPQYDIELNDPHPQQEITPAQYDFEPAKDERNDFIHESARNDSTPIESVMQMPTYEYQLKKTTYE